MTDIKFSSDVVVELIKFSASDADVVAAARVSTAGERSLDFIDDEVAAGTQAGRGLINYLVKNRHGSPFEHSVFTWYVKAPIFVWREHMRHRIASYNEESGRYRVLDPEFYIPGAERNLVQIGKTGHYDFVQGTQEQHDLVVNAQQEACAEAYRRYEEMLDAGIAKEVARNVLPVNIFSSAYVTMNSRALMNFLSLRTKSEDSAFPSYPQREIEMVAEKYEEDFARIMPLTHAAFVENGRVQP